MNPEHHSSALNVTALLLWVIADPPSHIDVVAARLYHNMPIRITVAYQILLARYVSNNSGLSVHRAMSK